MAIVSNVQLAIKKIARQNRSKVTIKYRICFTPCEVLAGSVFRESIFLRGDDLLFDDHLATIHSGCVKAEKGCVDRERTVVVSNRTLDEDGDTIILGIPVYAARDEIYARVVIVPFQPSGSSSDSNIVTGQFGPAA